VRTHISGMGLSYVVMLSAFYVDNGKCPARVEGPDRLFTYWLVPSIVFAPIP